MPKKKKPKAKQPKLIQCWRCAEVFQQPRRMDGELVFLDETHECPECGEFGFLPKTLPFEIPEVKVDSQLIIDAMERIDDTTSAHELRYLEWEGDLTFIEHMIGWSLSFHGALDFKAKQDLQVRALGYLLQAEEDGKVVVSREAIEHFFLSSVQDDPGVS